MSKKDGRNVKTRGWTRNSKRSCTKNQRRNRCKYDSKRRSK